MNNLKNLFIVPLWLLVVSATAQLNVQLQMGEENDMISSTEFKEIIGEDASGIYAILKSAPKVIRYDKNLMEVKFNILTQENELKGRDLEFLVLSNDKLWIFTSKAIKSENRKVLYAETMNKETLMPNEDKREVVYIPNTFSEAASFKLQKSPDKSKILIYCDYPFERGIKDQFGLCVLDAEMNKLWEKTIPLPSPKEKVIGIGSYSIENNGDVLVAGADFGDKAKASVNNWKGATGVWFNELLKSAIEKEIPYTYWVRRYNGQNDAPDEYPISFDNADVRNLKMQNDKNGNVIVAGFTSAKGNRNVSGYYFIRIDKEQKKVLTKIQTNFSSEQIRLGMNPKELEKVEKSFADKNNKDPFQIDIHHVLEKEDGSFMLVGQQYFNLLAWADQMNETDLVTRTKQHSYYTDINVISLDNEGTLKWTARVPKKYHVTNDPNAFVSGYAMTQTKNNLYFIFNNNPYNLKKAPDDNMLAMDAKGGMSVTHIYRVDNKGNVAGQVLFAAKEAKVRFLPKITMQADEKTFVFISQLYTRVRLGKLTLE